jgi:hypothetical protein
MLSEGFVLEQKPVFDWNHVPVGRVVTTRRDPKTHAATQLVLTLSPEAQTQLGTQELTVELPASMVFGMRRDSVTLDRSISMLKKNEHFASVLKK